MKAAFMITLGIALLLLYGFVQRGGEHVAYPPPQIVVNVPPIVAATPEPTPPVPPPPTCPVMKPSEPVKPAIFVTSIDSGTTAANECADKGAKCIAVKDPRILCTDRLVHLREHIFERHRAGNVKVRRVKLQTSPIIFDDLDEKKAYMLAVCQRRDEGAIEW